MTTPTPLTNDERTKRVRQLTQQAIQLALQSHWEEAIAANLELLKLIHRNAETLNRLGKAYFELGRYAESKKAYDESFAIDPGNQIAKKNLARLALLGDVAGSGDHQGERIDPRLFIEEIGKTGVTNLVNLAPRETLAKLTAGDQVYLLREGNTLFIRNARGETIGQVEPVLANRLIRFIEGGNQYAAGITEISDGLVRIIIRETFQHPTQLGKVSFLAIGPGALPRAESAESGRDDDDLDDDDDDESDGDGEEEFEEGTDQTDDGEIGGDGE